MGSQTHSRLGDRFEDGKYQLQICGVWRTGRITKHGSWYHFWWGDFNYPCRKKELREA